MLLSRLLISRHSLKTSWHHHFALVQRNRSTVKPSRADEEREDGEPARADEGREDGEPARADEGREDGDMEFEVKDLVKRNSQRYERKLNALGRKYLTLPMPVERPNVTELEWELVKMYTAKLKIPPDTKIEDIRSRVSLLKSIGAQVSDIMEVVDILLLSEEQLCRRWRLLQYNNMTELPKVTGPMIRMTIVGYRMRSRVGFLQLQSDGSGELCTSDYIKKKLNLTEKQFQLILKKNPIYKSKMNVKNKLEEFDQKVKLLKHFDILPANFARCFDSVVNIQISTARIRQRLWHGWYNFPNFEEFPLELLNCSSDEQFYVLFDLYRHNGCTSMSQVWEIFEKQVDLEKGFMATWGYNFLKMNPLRGKANIVFLIDKGFHISDIVNSGKVLKRDLGSLSEFVDVVQDIQVLPAGLNMFPDTVKASVSVNREVAHTFSSILGWGSVKLEDKIGTQPLEVLLKNYTFMRQIGFSELDLKLASGVLAHHRSLVSQKLEHFVRYNSDGELPSDNVALLNKVQYWLEKEKNFRSSLTTYKDSI